MFAIQTMLGIALALMLGIGAYWVWSNNMHFRERAVGASGSACRDLGVQLLDQTVALRCWRLQRGATGRVQVQRVYVFEYSGDGMTRCLGRVVFCGTSLDYICFEQSGHPLILPCGRVEGGDDRRLGSDAEGR